MENPPPPPPLHHHEPPSINPTVISTGDSNSNPHPTTTTLIINNNKKMKNKKKQKNVPHDPSQQSSSSCSSSNVLHSRIKGVRVSTNRRNPRGLNGKKRNGGEADALALPLGMSIAAFVAQVLEKKDATGEKMSADHLSEICSLAVKESLSNVFGDKFDCFVSNFERSFQTTLMTLRAISDSSGNTERSYLQRQSSSNDFHFSMKEDTSTSNLKRQSNSNDFHFSMKEDTSTSNLKEPTIVGLDEETDAHMHPIYSELAVVQDSSNSQQLACVPPNQLLSRVGYSQSSALTTFERSVSEQVRANNLKEVEIRLSMKRMSLKEAQIAVDCDSNILERIKLSMGISKANFKAGKFKTELEDSRHAQFLKKCVDCLVAGLLIMVACLAYGTYIHSYQKLVEANESCTIIKKSGSWWIPNQVASFNSGFQVLWCQVQVISQMLFGIFMISSIAYLLMQRSGTTNQAMPVTFILLLLGVLCGFAGKICIDTLGGSGNHWLLFWEILCLVHLFANICTSMLFLILHGPVTVVDQSSRRMLFPYWFRRVVFYAALLVYLPLLCGLTPFAGIGEWLEHFASLVVSRRVSE